MQASDDRRRALTWTFRGRLGFPAIPCALGNGNIPRHTGVNPCGNQGTMRGMPAIGVELLNNRSPRKKRSAPTSMRRPRTIPYARRGGLFVGSAGTRLTAQSFGVKQLSVACAGLESSGTLGVAGRGSKLGRQPKVKTTISRLSISRSPYAAVG